MRKGYWKVLGISEFSRPASILQPQDGKARYIFATATKEITPTFSANGSLSYVPKRGTRCPPQGTARTKPVSRLETGPAKPLTLNSRRRAALHLQRFYGLARGDS